jgi:N4-gp56 family major capsid protein
MAMQTFASQAGRINKFKGEILKHAVPAEVLGKHGRQVEMPRNQSDTYVARRYLPYGATSTNSSTQNRFFVDGDGDRGNAIVALHATAEGITGTPDGIVPVDITVVIQEYSCLYGFTNKTFELYEDDIPAEMKKQVGERVTFVNELILYGALRACTNQYFGGTGTTIATVNGGLTLGLVRKIVKSLQGNHCHMVTSVLKASAKYATDAVSPGYIVVCHTDLEPDIRDLPGFTPTEKYATGTPMPYEVGKVERFRFITSPDLPSIQNGGAAIGATGLYSTTGVSLDVYPMLVLGEDAYSQIAVRGLGSLDPTYLPPGQKSKSDPLGQRGYTGCMWRKAVMIENNGWMSVAFVGSKTLS